jgi:hypothetical protein
VTDDEVYEEEFEEFQDEIEDDTSWVDFMLSASYPGRLQELARSFGQPSRLGVGDLVEWRPGLKNRTFPLAGVVGIVVEVRDEPLWDVDDSSTRFFHEPLDVAIASLIGPDQEFAIYWYDSRRFEAVDADKP